MFPERLELIGYDFLKILYVCNNCIHDIKDRPTDELLKIIDKRYIEWRRKWNIKTKRKRKTITEIMQLQTDLIMNVH